MINLYYICNIGCDAETHGLARISDEDFPKFKEIIENLNKNSTYACMPEIQVYKINESLIRDYSTDDDAYDHLYLDGGEYSLKVSNIWGYNDGDYKLIEGVEQVI